MDDRRPNDGNKNQKGKGPSKEQNTTHKPNGRHGANGHAQTFANTEKPIIQLQAGQLNVNTREAEKALANHGQTYQRGGQLVRVARLDKETKIGDRIRPAGQLTIVPLDAPYLRVVLGDAANFCRFDQKEQKLVPKDASLDIAKGLLSSAGMWPNISALNTVSDIPIFLPNGRIIDQPGLDHESGVYFDPGNTRFPKIPDNPTRDDALAALDMLRDIVAEFPFEPTAEEEEAEATATASESVFLAAVLTLFVRPWLLTAPAFIMSAHKMASGKTLLAQVLSWIATGREAALMTYAVDQEALKKAILSFLIEGDTVVVLDNVETTLQSDTLCAVLTGGIYKDRLLGFSKMISVGTAMVLVITGNNVTVRGDLSTRVLKCTLDPVLERPEERNFDRNLHEYVPRHRGQLAAAALTILRAYHAAGRPAQNLTTFGRFEDWSAQVRDPLVWLDMPDPLGTRAEIEAHDPVRDQLEALLDAWAKYFGAHGSTVKNAISEAQHPPTGSNLTDEQQDRVNLHDALSPFAGKNGIIDPRSVGNFISKHARRVENGKRFIVGGEEKRAKRWTVESMS